VRVVVIDPSNPETLYAGTSIGLFKSTDGARHWVELTGGLPRGEVLTLTLDAEDPSTSYVGLRFWKGFFRSRDGGRTFAQPSEPFEPYLLASAPAHSGGSPGGIGILYAIAPPYDPQGLFRSADGGETWEPLLSLSSYHPQALVVHPARPYEVLVGGLRGIYRTEDGGDFWTFTPEDALGNPLGWVKRLARAPSDPQRAYALGFDVEFYASADGGRSWWPPPPLPRRCPGGALAVHPTDPEVVYLGCEDELLVSRDGGGSWSVVATQVPMFLDNSLPNHPFAIDPQRPEALYAGTSAAGVLKSRDGGATWFQASTGIDRAPVGQLVFHPSDPLTFYAVTAEALERTTDGGRSWEQRTAWSAGTNPGVWDCCSTKHLAIGPTNPALLYLAAGGFFRSTDGGASWSRLREGDSWLAAVDPSEPRRLYLGGADGLFVSPDRGRTWRQIGFRRTYTLVLDPAHPGTLYAEFATGGVGWSDEDIFRSTDGGETWTEIGGYYDLQIAPGEPSTLYSQCLKSTDGGDTWESLGLPMGPGALCGGLLVVPTQPPTLYASVYEARESTPYRSSDGGETWVLLARPDQSDPLPRIDYRAVAHPAAPDRVYGFGYGGGLFAIQLLGAEPLLLGDSRFEVRAAFRDLAGRYGAGRPLALTSEAGAFSWRQAPRQVVKVLDGRAVNGHFWVFSGALSPFESTLTVVDHASGADLDLFQPAGTPLSHADFQALPPLPDEPGLALRGWEAPHFTSDAGPCVPDRVTLCLLGGRFEVRLAWQEPDGGSYSASAIPFADDFGAFWRSSQTNLEVAVRLADGRPVNGRFWVLAGGLTNLEYTLTVTDAATWAVRRYHNRAGTLASLADFEAFGPWDSAPAPVGRPGPVAPARILAACSSTEGDGS
jgi:photosystem II stability/assembly factor-like uncharacterized protein